MRTNYFDRRHGGVLLFYFLFLAAAFLTRVLLLAKAHASVDWNFLRLLGVFGWGFLYDLAAASFFSTPLVLYLILVPQKLFAWRVHKQCFQVVFSIILYVLLFVAAAEWFEAPPNSLHKTRPINRAGRDRLAQDVARLFFHRSLVVRCTHA